MKNGKNIRIVLYIIISVIVVLLVTLNVIYFINNNDEKTKENNPIEENKEINNNNEKGIFSDEPIENINSKDAELHNKLNEYGISLYDNNKYTELSKKDEIYFASLRTLNEKYNYDISLFTGDDRKTCDIDNTGVYFDIDYKLSKKIEGQKPIVTILIGCNNQ